VGYDLNSNSEFSRNYSKNAKKKFLILR